MPLLLNHPITLYLSSQGTMARNTMRARVGSTACSSCEMTGADTMSLTMGQRARLRRSMMP